MRARFFCSQSIAEKLYKAGMQLPHKPGIYSITNVQNGNRYIGSATDLHNRCCKHRAMLRGGYHENEHLQRAWNKYGEEHFVFIELEICDTNDDPTLLGREQWYLDNARPEYNIEKIAGRPPIDPERSRQTKIGRAHV